MMLSCQILLIFFNSLKCPDGQRNIARHTVGLDFESLIDSCGRLLSPSGRFSVIIPTDGMDEFMRIASEGGAVFVSSYMDKDKAGCRSQAGIDGI